MELEHVALWVSDLDRAVAFYEALGMTQGLTYTWDGVENAYVGDGGDALQLKHDPGRTTPIAPNRADIDHISFRVADLDATVEAAVEAGGAVLKEPTYVEDADGRFAFVEDPEGYPLEFIEEA